MMWKIVLPVLVAVFAVDSSSKMLGGYTNIDVNDEGAQNALNFAVVEHNKQSNSMFLSQVAEVVGVKRQLVAGLKYVITVRMGKTPCRKGTANEVCAIHQDPAQALPYQCEFTVLVVPWRNETKMLEQNC
ncbi:Cystatin [Dissostichus eleginoides]|uniref:Cystatin n=1 Tax=Dissostichus eleginoides TaxID=100907 RepID=A0AAD9CNT4_DISEL|nr:Cystatin [Dissostichus eleginoides]